MKRDGNAPRVAEELEVAAVPSTRAVEDVVQLGFERRLGEDVCRTHGHADIEVCRLAELVMEAQKYQAKARFEAEERPVVPLTGCHSMTVCIYSHGDAAKIQLDDGARVESRVRCDNCGKPHEPWKCPRC